MLADFRIAAMLVNGAKGKSVFAVRRERRLAGRSYKLRGHHEIMKMHLKIIGLSLLALVGVLAVGASAAEAKWLLLQTKESVLLSTFNVDVDDSELLVPDLALELYCAEGKGTGHVQLSSDHKTMTGTIGGRFHGCRDLIFDGVCDVMGTGDPLGLISFGGSGVVSMDGAKVLLNTESSELAKVEYVGEECPLTEIDGNISGSMTFEIANPLEDSSLHQVAVVAQDLIYGNSAAELHDGFGGPVTGSIETLNDENLAVHLVGPL